LKAHLFKLAVDHAVNAFMNLGYLLFFYYVLVFAVIYLVYGY